MPSKPQNIPHAQLETAIRLALVPVVGREIDKLTILALRVSGDVCELKDHSDSVLSLDSKLSAGYHARNQLIAEHAGEISLQTERIEKLIFKLGCHHPGLKQERAEPHFYRFHCGSCNVAGIAEHTTGNYLIKFYK